ncbi:MAG: PPOX class F420-dependent oxidoreductase [Dietzia sp.]|uniref:PPOX class F420-dependent oxidoreductase n=1 Tax=Dietzia TaxID=37914 RepID=UPI0027162736|nr:PPOX class F420-dependent oxidoreductase [Dietzia sp.]MDO8393092.1 PPOX class F420-dependent oxidoreductase [Dietzia sp.]
MTDSPLDDDTRSLLLAPNPAVMATLRKDGSPVTVPTWYRLVEGDRIHLNLDAGRVRLQHLRRDPRVALSVIASEDWYTHASIQGRVVEIADDPDLSGIDALSTHYTGEPYSVRDRARVDAWVEIDHVHVWGRLRES